MAEDTRIRPMDKVTDVLIETLQDLVKNVGLEGAVLSGSDGIPIASALRPGMQEDRVAAISAAALTLGFRVAKDINRGLLEQLIVKSDNGLVLINGIADNAVLTAVAGENVKLGFLMIEMKKAHSRLSELILVYR